MPLYPIEYYEFFVKFNEGDYYTCHDLLEEIWMTDKQNLFLKGLLQMTVALYHYGYGNVKGARTMMKAGKVYLKSYEPSYWGINVNEVQWFIDQCLQRMPAEVDRVPFEEIDQLPELPSLILYLEE
ncbi:putative metal-dependent hydrolase [Bacillus iocasae]|uniref:Metal-dependent hydrolase n=1 Tax=Priestia iocasae TaxID=2291674 RepID=A0ABS2QYQ1_9BACI|nr:DUF309 domain-containing protein [Metabacillus iocasae]MBM7704620.1 putative metal-dependent hydrolase [Metabacillus iocasae]